MSDILVEDFISDKMQAKLFTLKNEDVIVKITNYGAAIVAILMKDKNGRMDDVVLGFDNLDGYLQDKGNIYYGATVGRCANRIAKGHFVIDEKPYNLAINNGSNHLHGGIDNFSSKLFDYELLGKTLKLSYYSKDMEEGYPGNLTLDVYYTLDANELIIGYQAVSDQDTVCNITNHTYYNLNGEGSGSIYDHELLIKSDTFIGCDEEGLGKEEMSVVNTPFDFRDFHAIGERIDEADIQLKNGAGYDHHFIFNDDYDQLILKSEKSGRSITFSSTQNGAQIYTANWFGEEHGKGNSIYHKRDGVAIEPQWMPDAINRENQPTLLKAGEVYKQVTVMKFNAEGEEA